MEWGLHHVGFPGLAHSRWGYEALYYRRTHDARGRNVASFWLIDAEGNWETETNMSEPGVGHSERICWNNTEDDCQNDGYRIFAIYTDREPCGPSNANCSALLSNIPDEYAEDVLGFGCIPVFYLADWPDASDPRMADLVAGEDLPIDDFDINENLWLRITAKELRARGTKEIRRFHTAVAGRRRYYGPAFGDPHPGF